MRLILFTLVGCLLSLTACQRDSVPTLGPKPTAAFSVEWVDTTNHLITVGTYDYINVINRSTNGDTYLWSLGNDSTTTQKEPPLFYPKAGLYTLSLTTLTKDGQKATTSRQVRVRNRVIKQVRINALLPDYIQSSVLDNHSFKNAKMWAIIKLGANGATYPFGNQTFSAPVIYQTPIIARYDSTQAPYTFDVPGSPVLDFAALDGPFFPRYNYKGLGYGLELYVQDSNGTYLVFSSYAAFIPLPQVGAVIWSADIARNTFVVRYQSVQLLCDYE